MALHETGKIALSVPYIRKFMLHLFWTTWNHLQISMTNSQIGKVANYFVRWCFCFRAFCLITTQSKVKIIVPCERQDNFLSGAYVCWLAFSFSTLHHDADLHDGVMTFLTWPQKLHTSATFCHHLCQKWAYC